MDGFFDENDEHDSYEMEDGLDVRMAETAPSSIVNNMQDRFDGHALTKLADGFQSCSIMNWEKFAISFLHLKPGNIQNIDADKKQRCEKIYAMFEQWHEANDDATYGKAIDILNKAKLVGVEQEWFSRCRAEGECEALQRFFRLQREKLIQISERNISDVDFEKCIHKLGVHNKWRDVNSLTESPSSRRMKILFMYLDKFGYGENASNRLLEVFGQIQDRPHTRQETLQDHPFYVRLRTRSIRRCQGCRELIDPGIKKVIAHMEWVKYRVRGQMKESFTKGHYHCSEDCVKRKYPNFSFNDLLKTTESGRNGSILQSI